MKFKYQIDDEVILNDGTIGKIQYFQVSIVDNEETPSYWILFSKEVFPDNCARNIWESSIKKLNKRELKFEGIDDWNRPIFKDHNNNRFGDVDNLFNWGDTFEIVTSKISEKHICYFGDKFGCEPMGTLINPDKIKLVKEWSSNALILDK